MVATCVCRQKGRWGVGKHPTDGRRPGAAAAPRTGAARGSFSRFLAVGGTCTAVQYLLLALLVDGVGAAPTPASGVAYAASAALNYELSRRFTFFGRRASWRSVRRFALVSALGLALNLVTFALALQLGAPHYLLAQAIATGVVLGVSFTLYRVWAFRH
jgi:putative flippase GtrA